MSEIIQYTDEANLIDLRKRVKKGELEELKGAYGEPVFREIAKSDFSPERQQAINDWEKQDSQKLIDRVKKLRIAKT